MVLRTVAAALKVVVIVLVTKWTCVASMSSWTGRQPPTSFWIVLGMEVK